MAHNRSAQCLCAKLRHRAASFDHLVGASEQRRRHGEAERPGSLEIDHQLVFGRLLDWEFPRLGSLENTISVNCCLAILIGKVYAIGDQTAAFRELANRVDGRNAISRNLMNNQVAIVKSESIQQNDQAAIRLLPK